jgi:hypothetical protein
MNLRVAGVPIRLTFSSPALAEFILPAVSVQRTDDTPGAAVRWHVTDDSNGYHPAWDPHEVRIERLPRDGIRFTQPTPPLVEVEHPSFGIELWGSAAALASGEVRSHPAGLALSSLLARRGRTTLHVAAVEHMGRAALIVGAPGAGKSTTALAAAVRGAGFIGDDLCVLDAPAAAPAPVVHALFASVKLWPDSERALEVLDWTTLGRTNRNKPVLAVTDRVRLVNAAPLAALIILRPAEHEKRSELTPIAPVEALRGLIPTARGSHVGDVEIRRWLPMATCLSREVPAFALRLEWDLDRVADGVFRAIEQGTGRRS